MWLLEWKRTLMTLEICYHSICWEGAPLAVDFPLSYVAEFLAQVPVSLSSWRTLPLFKHDFYIQGYRLPSASVN